jgi:predicted metal-binding membrane protein
MEVSRHRFYLFDLDEHASLMSFLWTEKSVAMTVDDYKNAIREYARLVLEHRARCALVEVTWLILTFYVPLLWVSLGLIVWQLYSRQRERLSFARA